MFKIGHYLEFICYDDGCHLRKFAQHPKRRDVSAVANRISKIEIVLDRFHYRNEWCKKTCNPNQFEQLKGVS